MGMVATVLNGLALQDALESLSVITQSGRHPVLAVGALHGHRGFLVCTALPRPCKAFFLAPCIAIAAPLQGNLDSGFMAIRRAPRGHRPTSDAAATRVAAERRSVGAPARLSS
jgi:hypothetical protein